MKIKNSIRFRLLVVISVIYVALTSSRLGDYGFDFDDFIWLVSPIWVFWASVWIWSSTFENFFGVQEDMTEKKQNYLERKQLKKWIYVEVSKAKTHKYYGSGKGWALILSISIIISSVMDIATYYLQQDLISAALQDETGNNQFVILFKSMEISVWLLTFLSAICLYALWLHRLFFQKMVLTLFILELAITLFYVIAIGEMSESGFKPVEIIELAASLSSGVVWLVYVFRSRRINITTRNRLRNRDIGLLDKANT